MTLETYNNNRNHIYNTKSIWIWLLTNHVSTIIYIEHINSIDCSIYEYNYLQWLIINAPLTPLYDNSRVVEHIDAIGHILYIDDVVT